MKIRTLFLPTLTSLAVAGALHAQLLAPLDAPSPATGDVARFFWADFDADGLEDAYVISPGQQPLLLNNRGDGTLADITASSGLAETGHPRFAAWSDFDADGDLDLFIATFGGPGHLFSNLGAGVFVDVTTRAGLDHEAPVLQVSWLDMDSDGLADLHLSTVAGEVIYHNSGPGGFESVELGLEAPTPGVTNLRGAVDSRAGAAVDREPSVDPTPSSDHRSARPGRDNRRGARGRGAATSDAASPVGTTVGDRLAVGPATNILECVESLRDQSGGDCLQASSLPTLGQLYPISSNLFVDISGSVGMNSLIPTARLDVIQSSFGATALSAVRGSGINGPTIGHLAAQGDAAFDGITTTDWAGHEMGVTGISVGGSFADNYGIMGHSNNVGVRGELSTEPTTTFGELGLSGGIGLRAAGSLAAADLTGNLNMAGGDMRLDDGSIIFEPTGIGTAKAIFENNAGSVTFEIDGEAFSGSEMRTYNDLGFLTMTLDSDNGGDGAILLRNQNGSTRINLDGGNTDLGGDITVYAADGSSTVFLDGDNAFDGGQINVRNDIGQTTVDMNGDTGTGNSGQISLWDRTASQMTVALRGRDAAGSGAELQMEASNGTITVDIDADNGGGGLQFLEADGSVSCDLMGTIYDFRNSAGSPTWVFNRITGLQSIVMDTGEDGERLFYGLEATEPWFEDFGSGQLTNGSARIQLDRVFRSAVTIDDEHPMKVFVTLYGKSRGVWVERGLDHFIVHEQGSGTSNVEFDWRVVAKRRGAEGVRLQSLAVLAQAEAVGMDSPVQHAGFEPATDTEDFVDESAGTRAPVVGDRAERKPAKMRSVPDPIGPRRP